MSNLFLNNYSFWNYLSIFLARRRQSCWFTLVILLGRRWGWGVSASSMDMFFTTGKRCRIMEKCAVFWNVITWNRREKRQFQMFILIKHLLNWLLCSQGWCICPQGFSFPQLYFPKDDFWIAPYYWKEQYSDSFRFSERQQKSHQILSRLFWPINCFQVICCSVNTFIDIRITVFYLPFPNDFINLESVIFKDVLL